MEGVRTYYKSKAEWDETQDSMNWKPITELTSCVRQ